MVSEPLTRISTVFFFFSAAFTRRRRPVVSTATTQTATALVIREYLDIRFLSVVLFSQDRLDQIPDMRVDVLEGFFVSGAHLFRCALHERRVLHVPVEAHRLGWRRRKNSLRLLRQRHDH